MSTHLENSIDLAGKVISLVEDHLRSLTNTIDHWPGEYRAIVWDAVAEVAVRRAERARNPS